MTIITAAPGAAVDGLEDGALGPSSSSTSAISTAALLGKMLDSGTVISDLFLSPGRPPQVEQQGVLTPVAVPALPLLRPEDTSRPARDLAGQNAQALRPRNEAADCQLT